MDVGRRFLAPRQIQIATTRCAAAHKYRVIAAIGLVRQEALHGFDAVPALERDTHVKDIARLFVNHRLRQAKARNLRPHEATRLGFAIKHRHLITERSQIARHRQ